MPQQQPENALDILFGEAAAELDGAITQGVENTAGAISNGIDAVYNGIDAAGDFANKTIPDKIAQTGSKIGRKLTPDMQARMDKLSANMSAPAHDEDDMFFGKKSRYY